MIVKLLLLCDLLGESGGTERYLERIIPALVRSGLGVEIAARRVIDARAFGAHAVEIAWAGESEPPNREAALSVERLLVQIRPDVVITSNVFDVQVLRAVRNAPRWVARVHDHRPFCPNGDRHFPQFPAICTHAMGARCIANAVIHGCVSGPRRETLVQLRRRQAVRDALSRADTVVVSSAYMAAECERNGIDPRRVAVTASPLPLDAYAAGPYVMPRERRLLFAGRIEPQKGLCSLIRALARIPRARRPRLTVAGRGASEETLARELAQALGVAVEWRGWLGQAELRSAIDESCAVALPSLWAEPFGLIGIEAQARGRPAVAYAVGGVADWIWGAGLTARAGDEAQLAAAIEQVLHEPAWSRYAHAAFERAQTYRIDRHVERLLEICTFTQSARRHVACES